MKRIILLLVLGFSILTGSKLSAQSYFDHAIGARLGYPLAVSYKKYISDYGAIELFAGQSSRLSGSALTAGAAYQKHFPLSGDLDWYVGGGASMNIFDSSIGIGIQGYLGLQYNFDDIPLNLTLDWIPSFVGGNFGGNYAGLAARYILD